MINNLYSNKRIYSSNGCKHLFIKGGQEKDIFILNKISV